MADDKVAKQDAKKPPAFAASSGDLQTATGSTDFTVAGLRLSDILQTFWRPGQTQILPEQLDHLFQTMLELAPADPSERMLVGQMIGCYNAAMECFRRAMIPEQGHEARMSNLKQAERLSGTYAKLLEALDKHRGKGQQKVTVEHVHVAAGGQAIVGNVDTGHAQRGSAGRRKAAPPQIAHQPAPPNPLNTLDQMPRAASARKKPPHG